MEGVTEREGKGSNRKQNREGQKVTEPEAKIQTGLGAASKQINM